VILLDEVVDVEPDEHNFGVEDGTNYGRVKRKDFAMEGKKALPTTIEEYIAGFPGEVQDVLIGIRAVVKEAAPQAEEKISYQMPGYYLNGFLVSFSAWKRHIGFYPRTPGMEAFEEELSAYKGTKGSVHFPLDQPMPYELIRKMVKVRVSENMGKTAV
jgi:uncharacterized protein YdhG (YjbR/CyaY superfamily)